MNVTPTARFISSLASWAWLEETAAGPVALLLGLASLPRCADRDEVKAYLGVCALNGQLRLGTALTLHNNPLRQGMRQP